MNDINYCATCHKQTTGCCLIHDENPFMFGLTINEIRKICNETNLSSEEFIDKDIVSEELFNDVVKLHSMFKQIFFNKQRLKLKVIDNKCVFLCGNGCKLSIQSRPHYCRLYPFWFKSYFIKDDMPLKQDIFLNAEELRHEAIKVDLQLILLQSDRCLAQKNVISYDKILSRLSMDIENLKSIFLDLLKDSYLHQEYMKTSPKE